MARARRYCSVQFAHLESHGNSVYTDAYSQSFEESSIAATSRDTCPALSTCALYGAAKEGIANSEPAFLFLRFFFFFLFLLVCTPCLRDLRTPESGIVGHDKRRRREVKFADEEAARHSVPGRERRRRREIAAPFRTGSCFRPGRPRAGSVTEDRPSEPAPD